MITLIIIILSLLSILVSISPLFITDDLNDCISLGEKTPFQKMIIS